MSKRQPTFLEERGRFMILDETTMAWADWEGIPKAPVGFLVSSPTASTTLSVSQQEPRRPGVRSRGASRSSTPARLATDPGTSANTSPGTSASALPAPPPLSPEAMAACMKQFGAAYASLSQMRANLGGLGRSLGVFAPQHHHQHPSPFDFAGGGGGGEVGAGAGGGGMDPKPPQPDDKPVGVSNGGNLNTSSSSSGSSSGNGNGNGNGNGAGTLPISSGSLSAAASPAPASSGLAPASSTLLSSGLVGVGGGEGGLGSLAGAFGDVGGERSVKAELEATLATKRKLVYELKAAKEESELLKKEKTILEQKLARLMTPTVSA